MAKYKVSFTVDDDHDDVDADLRGEVLGALTNGMEQPVNDLTVELVDPAVDCDATECTDCSGTGENADFSVCKTCDGSGLPPHLVEKFKIK